MRACTCCSATVVNADDYTLKCDEYIDDAIVL